MTPERQKVIQRVLSLRQPDITVILENVMDPHNVSAVLRTCDAVGIAEIYVIDNREPRRKRWGYRSSSGALKWVQTHRFSEPESCFQAVRQRYDKIYSTHLDDTAVSVYDLNLTEKVALLFGNEGTGVSSESLALCDGNFIIPQMGIIQSLNISVACAISIYEAYRQKQLAGHYQTPRLPADRKADLLNFWEVVNFEG